MHLELVRPSTQYKDSFLEGLAEFQSEGRDVNYNIDDLEKDFQSFTDLLNGYSEGLNLPEGYVPETMFWLIDDGKYIGNVSIRHYLTEKLKAVGGHIGYAIRPSERKKGYGKEILRLVLPEAKKLGLEKALLTCDDNNIGSIKIIESNGGRLENIVENGEGHPKKRRYWINL